MNRHEPSLDPALEFGVWVRRQRKALDLTQDALARQVGCAVATIRRIEAEERRASRQLAERLAVSLQVPSIDQAAFVTWARTGRVVSPSPIATLTVPSPTPAEPPSDTAGGSAARASQPAPPPTLIGRDHDLAAVRVYLQRDDVRLLTLTGSPGIGKTQLGLHVGESLGSEFADGVVFVSLAALSDADLVIATIAQTLHVRESSQQSLLEALHAYLHPRHTLLILDNFEQVLAATPAIGGLLVAAPRLKILVTSRTALNLASARDWSVPPLALPESSHSFAELVDVPAIALFVARAQAVNPSLRLNPNTAPAIAAICTHLDGVPLAIELAAAWISILTPHEILDRLDQRFTFLTRRHRDATFRQQTLYEAIAASYALLSGPAQSLFDCLGVFRGPFTLAAATAVGDDGSQGAMVVLDCIAQLVDHSLVWRAHGAANESVFGMLETIRTYAQNNLAARPDQHQIYRRQSIHYCQWVEMAEPELIGPQQGVWLDRLAAQQPNLRTALRWASDHSELSIAASTANALWRFWHIRGNLEEGRMWLETIIKRRQELPDALAAQVLNRLGQLLLEQARYPEAQRQFEESFAVYRSMGDTPGMARVLNNLGMIAEQHGEYQRAQRLHQESLALKRTLGDPLAIANSLNNLGIVIEAQGQYAAAWTVLAESLALRRAHGDHWSVAVSLLNLGQVAYLQGAYHQALQLLQESIILRRDFGDHSGIAWCLEAVANIARALGFVQEAVQLWGSADALRGARGAPLPISQRAQYETQIALARAATSAAHFQAAWQSGQERSPEAALDFVLDLCATLSPLATDSAMIPDH
jgi:predicted ATPase/transcriptional regulator with XRE-family HTH domain